MTGRTARRVAWSAFLSLLALASIGFVLVGANGPRGKALENGVFATIFVAMAFTGAVIASRHQRNAIGWLLLGSTATIGVAFVSEQYAIYSLLTRPGALPAGNWAAWMTEWAWGIGIVPLMTFLFLLFPDGRLPSPRWRPVAWGVVAALGVFLVAGMLNPEGTTFPTDNPIGLRGVGWLDDAVGMAFILLAVLAVLSAVSLILRFRRAVGEERQQIKWLAFAAAFVILFLVSSTVADLQESTTEDSLAWTFFSALAFLSLPVATGIAILKYRLYEIDVVIRKTLIVGLLAAFITAVYVAVVVGIGALAAGRFSNRVLPIVAAVVIAVAFQPAREAARRLADRMVLGERATPYEVLSAFSERVGTTYATEDLLPRMARVVGEGTGAQVAEVWLRLGDRLHRSATWPSPAERPGAGVLPMSDGELPSLGDVSESLAVRHHGELLGAIAVTKPPNEPLTPDERRLLSDLAAQAGLVLRNVRLTEELRARLEELQASRQRIVAAQDDERRRIERNIHDGAQQQLVALAVKLGLARTVGKSDPARADQMLAELQEEAQQALEDLRDLARGIYPPLLADKGLAAALQAQARKSALPIRVDSDGVGRYPQDVEAAVYFCALEALQNVAKYAEASQVDVRVGTDGGGVWFEVSDDGRGFEYESVRRGAGLTNMADRMSALGGTLRIESAPGRGTTVRGRIPVPA